MEGETFVCLIIFSENLDFFDMKHRKKEGIFEETAVGWRSAKKIELFFKNLLHFKRIYVIIRGV